MFLNKHFIQNARSQRIGMRNRVVPFGIIVLLICIGLSGCEQKIDPEKFTGTWTYQGSKDLHTDTFIFYNNGSVYCIYHYPGSTVLQYQWNTYTIIEHKIKIGNSVYEFSFSEDYQTLTLNNTDLYIKE